jgi:hypothetical protein
MFHLLHQLDVDGNTRSRIYVDNPQVISRVRSHSLYLSVI